MSTLTQSQFDEVAAVARQRWGLHLTDRKQSLVQNRIAKFLLRSEFRDVTDYLDHLKTAATEEDMLLFFDLLSTNTTYFFREMNHFDYLEREFYTPLARGNMTFPGRKIRIWSAACSNGSEPYSIGIHAREHLPNIDSWDFKILATDLSQTVLDQARAGVYAEKMLEQTPQSITRKYFHQSSESTRKEYRVMPEIRQMVAVQRLNLMESWPMRGPFNIIFCRNVMIYFDRETRETLVRRLIDLLHPGGILIIGSAETLSGLDINIRTVQPSVYVK